MKYYVIPRSTSDIFFMTKRPAETRLTRDRDFFEHNTIIWTTAVTEGRPPWRSIIWNESARDRPTWRVIFQCGTRTVPHACYYDVHAGSEPEIALAPGRAHDRPKSTKKHKKHNKPRASSRTPNPIPPPPSSQATISPSRGHLKAVSPPWKNVPSCPCFVTTTQQYTSSNTPTQQFTLRVTTQQFTIIFLFSVPWFFAMVGGNGLIHLPPPSWQHWRAITGCVRNIEKKCNYMGISQINVSRQSTQFTHLAWKKRRREKKSETNNK